MIIYSHRGIDLDRSENLAENSLAAFHWAASQGFGVELDLQLTHDQKILVAHDADTKKWSGGKLRKMWSDLHSAELRSLEASFGPICWLTQVFELAKEYPSMHFALHVKSSNQKSDFLRQLSSDLNLHPELFPRLLIFDLKAEAAATLRNLFPSLPLAPSVALDRDVSKYQHLVGGTLFNLDTAIAHRSTYDWTWLDEWDRNPAHVLYTPEICRKLRSYGFRVAVISPELHRQENHPDSENLELLELRWYQILALKPDAICTDYPARLKSLLASTG